MVLYFRRKVVQEMTETYAAGSDEYKAGYADGSQPGKVLPGTASVLYARGFVAARLMAGWEKPRG